MVTVIDGGSVGGDAVIGGDGAVEGGVDGVRRKTGGPQVPAGKGPAKVARHRLRDGVELTFGRLPDRADPGVGGDRWRDAIEQVRGGFEVTLDATRDRGLVDGEGRRGNHGRQQPLEPLPRSGQLRRDARGAGMDLGADMVGDEADDALAVRRRQPLAGVGEAVAEPVDPQPPVGVQHYLEDGRVREPGGDVRPERSPEHAGAALDRFGLERVDGHTRPRI